MHMHQQSFHQQFYFLLSSCLSIMGITILPLHTLLLNADILIKQTYQFLTIHILFILSATVCGSPTSAVPAPPLTSPIPAHKLGLISNDSLVPLFKCVIRFDQPNHILQMSFEQAQLFHYPHIELNVRPLPMLLLLSLTIT